MRVKKTAREEHAASPKFGIEPSFFIGSPAQRGSEKTEAISALFGEERPQSAGIKEESGAGHFERIGPGDAESHIGVGGLDGEGDKFAFGSEAQIALCLQTKGDATDLIGKTGGAREGQGFAVTPYRKILWKWKHI